MSNYQLIQGDCLERLRELPAESVDSVVTDPPAGIGFMGKEWDSDKGGREQWIAWLSSIATEMLRVLKPGGHALVWAIPRTSHWTATALEEAGFEIRDRVSHLFGSGFPKSLNISKAIDRAAGATRPVVGTRMLSGNAAQTTEEKGGTYASATDAIGVPAKEVPVTAAATPEAEQWDGWGTALKPAVEDWWLVRKPIEEKTVAKQVLKTGTGALNVDGCRVQTDEKIGRNPAGSGFSGMGGYINGMGTMSETSQAGRWPAHLLLSHGDDCINVGDVLACAEGCAVMSLDGQSGDRPATLTGRADPNGRHSNPGDNHGSSSFGGGNSAVYADSGGASRYFNTFEPNISPGFLYTPKASRKERELGCDALPIRSGGEATDREDGSAGLSSPRAGAGRNGGRRNIHPTVKPIQLMRWLCRLITPPGGTVLDPFMGSGSTGVAAIQEGFRFIGIELEPDSLEIASARVSHAAGATEVIPCAS